jgi:hypothetical protein
MEKYDNSNTDDEAELGLNIDLGAMIVYDEKWQSFWSRQDNSRELCGIQEQINEGKDPHIPKWLDPFEIVIPRTDITIHYEYTIDPEYSFRHTTTCKLGFTRFEISMQIMKHYNELANKKLLGYYNNTSCLFMQSLCVSSDYTKGWVDPDH